MVDNSSKSKTSQERKEKLAKNLTGAKHEPTTKRTTKTVVRTSEIAKLSHINVIAADERLKTGSKEKAKNFTMIPNEIFEKTNLSHSARYLWIELWGYCNGKKPKGKRNKAYPSQETLADRLNVSERGIQRYVKELRRNSLLKVEQTKAGLNNSYFLYAPEASPNDTKTQSRRQGCRPKDDKGVAPGNSADNHGHDSRGSKKVANKTKVNKTNMFTTEDSHNSQQVELFASVTSKELNDKDNNALNINELIATLQTEALNASVVFEAEKVDAGKLRGQVKHLEDELAGSGNVVQFYEWYFKDPRRVKRFKKAPNSFKLHKVMDELANYKTVQRKSRESERTRLVIELTGPTSPYASEDLQDLTLEDLEDLERETVGTS